MNIFRTFSQNLIKWWQVHITPILRINNNKKGQGAAQGGDGHWEQQNPAQTDAQTGGGQGMGVNTQGYASDGTSDMQNQATGTGTSSGGGMSADAMEVLNRINREKDEVRLREVEAADRKREEEQRIASIMNSNKVDVDAFIEEGKHLRSDDASETDNSSGDASSADADEQMRIAQEIIDRLNREAAEDEAKKQAEIEAARAAAKEAGLA